MVVGLGPEMVEMTESSRAEDDWVAAEMAVKWENWQMSWNNGSTLGKAVGGGGKSAFSIVCNNATNPAVGSKMG